MGRKILFLSRWFPYPADNGSKIRIYSLLRGLSQHYEITLLSFTQQVNGQPPPPPGPLAECCAQVYTVPYTPFNPHSKTARLGFLSPTPRSVIDTYSLDMERLIREALRQEQYDLIIASQIDMAVYSKAFAGVPAIFEEVEVGALLDQFARARSLRQRLRYTLTWAKYRRYVGRLLQDFALCSVVSETEKRLLTGIASVAPPIVVIPNCVEAAAYAPFVVNEPQPSSLIFTGSLTFEPNYQAMCWFISRVLPQVQQAVPDVRLTITGHAGERALPPASGVTLTGFVPDIRPLVAGSWASLAPIHQGGGTRLKILESMALGTPVVATTKGAEGLDVSDGEHLLLADSPEMFAAALIRLLQDGPLRARLAENAAERLFQRYDWVGIMPEVVGLVENVIQQAGKVTIE